MGAFDTPLTDERVSLDDKYDLGKRRIFITGTQGIVRLALMQRERDRLNGLNTAGFVSGYRGSPLGGVDQQFTKARKQLEAANITFIPGLNEELAATACWGTQTAELRGQGKYDGVFSFWYGKGPGVDRCGDVFRHANMAGTSRHGGVLALMGDDHTAESSTTAHQSEFHFVDQMIPILNPAGVQEMLDYGLYGIAMSRFCGTWTALKCVKDNVESTASIDGSIDRIRIIIPDDFTLPAGGLGIRLGDTVLEREARLHDYKRDAMLAFIRANHLNTIITSGGQNPRIGIITTGKSYLDVRQAFDDLGIDEVQANALGIRLFKVACPWPLVREELLSFANGLDLIMVVEEKRSLIEVQVREELYGSAHQPTVIGKKDENGQWLFPVKGALDPNDIALALGERLLKYHDNSAIRAHLKRIRQAQERLKTTTEIAVRTPYFCSGCPHNSSTKIPDGSRAYAGIGCHYMVQWMDRGTEGFTQMGGEGANWIGEAPFSTCGHVFQNLGDGTYNHSGVLALRWAVDTKTRMTYKILFNDAVAMTGGQAHEGGLTVDMIARQVRAEGVERIALVTDEPDKYPARIQWPSGLSLHHRDDLDAVQRELREHEGVSVLIYDQTCAAEKRRRRKRGTFADPDKRVIINEQVCEGCGDCGVASNCVSVQPLETEFGRKRQIDQSSCNKDFSCVNGFCPSFVTVEGGKLKKAGFQDNLLETQSSWPDLFRPSTSLETSTGFKTWMAGTSPAMTVEACLPHPTLPPLDHSFSIVVTGMGGTGIVTVGAILGMAAHLEGKGCGMIDMAGLAQKGGAVFSHVRIAPKPEDIHAIRAAAGDADLVLGCDLVVTGNRKVLASVKSGTSMIVNTAQILPGDFTRNADFHLPTEQLKRAITDAAGADHTHMIDATALALALLGNAQAANVFLLGYAYQKGTIPLGGTALEDAIRLNGVSVNTNLQAFTWGRRAAVDPQTVMAILAAKTTPTNTTQISQTLDEKITRRIGFLTNYQNAAYAKRYQEMVKRVREVEQKSVPGQSALTEAVATYLFKLMAYKDEYEVARLYSDGAFIKKVHDTFEGDTMKLRFHLAPPLFARKDPITGLPRKTTFGPWMIKVFLVLAKFKGLRGTWFDPFGYTHERRTERQLITDYDALLENIMYGLTAHNHATAVALASIPEHIRGFGHVKARHLADAKAKEAALLTTFHHQKQGASHEHGTFSNRTAI